MQILKMNFENTDENSSELENNGDILEKPEVLTPESKKDDNLAKPEIDSISENNNLNLIDENKIDDKKQNVGILTEKNKKPSVKDDFFKPKINFEEKNNKTITQSKNKTKILAPNTGFNQKNANFTLQILLLSAFEILIVFKRRVLNEVF